MEIAGNLDKVRATPISSKVEGRWTEVEQAKYVPRKPTKSWPHGPHAVYFTAFQCFSCGKEPDLAAKVQILKELSELVKAVSDPAALPEATSKSSRSEAEVDKPLDII